MARAIWTGAISFGLVTIPVKLVPAVRADEDVHFHYLHKKDLGRLKNVRTCEKDGEEVPWSETVRGFQYDPRDKDAFVVLTDEELKSLRPEATQAVEIQAFVDRSEIDPMLFDVPYYLEPQKSGRHAYALLRDSLAEAGKVGIARVILRTRAHLAALSPSGAALVVELLRYPHEVVASSSIDLPPAKEKTAPGERKAAAMLIDAMSRPFVAGDYVDDYEEKLRAALEARAKAKGRAPAPATSKPAKATNVVDLVEVLKRSLAGASAGKRRPARRGSKKAARPAARHAS